MPEDDYAWLPREDVTEDEGLEHLLRRYLAAFGPSTLADAATWAGVARASLLRVAERMRLRRLRDEDGQELVDLARAPLLPEDAAAPVRFLGHWDAVLLGHARRTQILPERFRGLVFATKAPQSMATFLVDGAVAGAWRVERAAQRATLRLEPFERHSDSKRIDRKGKRQARLPHHLDLREIQQCAHFPALHLGIACQHTGFGIDLGQRSPHKA
jgi:hypothetical protein